MRSASVILRLGALALLLGAAGCSTVSGGYDAMRDAVTPSSRSSAPTSQLDGAPPAAPGARRAAGLRRARQPDDAARLRRCQPRPAQRPGRRGRARRTRRWRRPTPTWAGRTPTWVSFIGSRARSTNRSPSSSRRSSSARASRIYLNQLGIAYRQQGQFAKSRDAYQRALALDPGYAAALLNLGILYDLYLGDTARALELYGRYLAVMPNGDATVTKWVADLKNRKPGPITVSRQEKP